MQAPTLCHQVLPQLRQAPLAGGLIAAALLLRGHEGGVVLVDRVIGEVHEGGVQVGGARLGVGLGAEPGGAAAGQ